MIKIKRYIIISAICLMVSSAVYANQVKLPIQEITTMRTEGTAPIDEFTDELDFDYLDDEDLDVSSLTPAPAKLAALIFNPFFELYNKISHWLENRNKNNYQKKVDLN